MASDGAVVVAVVVVVVAAPAAGLSAAKSRRATGRASSLGSIWPLGRASVGAPGPGSCQGSRQSSSSSRIQSSLFSTQRPSPSKRGRDPAVLPSPRPGGRDPGRAPDTPSTSCRPALIRRSMPCSRRSGPPRRGAVRLPLAGSGPRGEDPGGVGSE